MTFDPYFRKTFNNSANLITAHNKRLLAAYQEAAENIKEKIIVYRMKNDWSPAGKAKLTRVEMLYNEIDKEIARLSNTARQQLVVTFAKNFEETYYHTAFIYEKGVNFAATVEGGYCGKDERITLNFPVLNVETVEASFNKHVGGMTYLDRIERDRMAAQWKLRHAVAVCVAEGESTRELAKRLALINGEMDKISVQSIITARTELLRAYSYGQETAESEAIKAGIKFTYQWCSALDGKTRPTHQQADGQVAEFTEDGIPFFIVGGERLRGPRLEGPHDEPVDPKEIVNCRCRRLAFPGSFRPTKRSARMPNDDLYMVEGNMTYEEWRNTAIGKQTIVAEIKRRAEKEAAGKYPGI